MCLPPPPDDDLPDGVGAKFVFGNSLKENKVSRVVYRDFLPRASTPSRRAFETQKKGVSAKKLVVSLQL